MKRLTRLIVLIIVAIVLVLPINGLVAYAEGAQEVYLGGELVGLSTITEGLYVTKICDVTTKKGKVTPLKDKGIMAGDILISVNGHVVNTREEVSKLLKNGNNKLKLISVEGEKEITAEPALDVLTNDLRLGIYLEGGIDGIGTLTYTTQEKRFSALGHLASLTDTPALLHKGVLYKADFLGIERSKVGTPGKINGVITRERIGNLTLNSLYGVYGKSEREVAKEKLISIGSRYSVTNGKASMFCNVDGEVKEYSIEIMSAFLQPTVKEKGMVIKITDKRILDNLGGIVQGMSGSPIVQNGKLIGAVTHVIVDEPEKGYGIYADFLLEVGKKVQ